MVKIVNPLGEVKIGRQGEVVYQRKYGEQIRRQASPKRAMASQAQIAHRQLYRDALDWRKQLSLPNRRYLEGYCIANGVVDGYHIPLPWSRFALKLYLEKVRFVIRDITITPPSEKDTLYEYYNTGDDTWYWVYQSYWRGQTFTPLLAHKITSVKLKIFRQRLPGTIHISIRATSEGLPIGGDLCVGTTDGDTLTTAGGGEWREISLGDGYQLEQGVMYAIIGKGLTPSDYNSWGWRADTITATYPRGTRCYSTTQGATWFITEDEDFMFEEWERKTVPGKKTALLHVRHPALMTVVQKRGELIVRGYDTLSSLDEEYLTGQVGLDIQAGDDIEATTLPGIEARFTF